MTSQTISSTCTSAPKRPQPTKTEEAEINNSMVMRDLERAFLKAKLADAIIKPVEGKKCEVSRPPPDQVPLKLTDTLEHQAQFVKAFIDTSGQFSIAPGKPK